MCGNLLRLDFGLSAVRDETGVAKSNMICGTPEYMSPEAFEGYSSCKSDVWAIGVITYEARAASGSASHLRFLSIMWFAVPYPGQLGVGSSGAVCMSESPEGSGTPKNPGKDRHKAVWNSSREDRHKAVQISS